MKRKDSRSMESFDPSRKDKPSGVEWRLFLQQPFEVFLSLTQTGQP
jgi:hypothetical protein